MDPLELHLSERPVWDVLARGFRRYSNTAGHSVAAAGYGKHDVDRGAPRNRHVPIIVAADRAVRGDIPEHDFVRLERIQTGEREDYVHGHRRGATQGDRSARYVSALKVQIVAIRIDVCAGGRDRHADAGQVGGARHDDGDLAGVSRVCGHGLVAGAYDRAVRRHVPDAQPRVAGQDVVDQDGAVCRKNNGIALAVGWVVHEVPIRIDVVTRGPRRHPNTSHRGAAAGDRKAKLSRRTLADSDRPRGLSGERTVRRDVIELDRILTGRDRVEGD